MTIGVADSKVVALPREEMPLAAKRPYASAACGTGNNAGYGVAQNAVAERLGRRPSGVARQNGKDVDVRRAPVAAAPSNAAGARQGRPALQERRKGVARNSMSAIGHSPHYAFPILFRVSS